MDESYEPAFDSETLIDPELDVRSERFNPLKALYSPDTPVPLKDVKIYDNVAQFESIVMRPKKPALLQTNELKQVAPISSVNVQRQPIEPLGRRFLPHQGMISGTGKKARHKRNILQKMNCDRPEGPIDALKLWRINGSRVKIYIRDYRAINGFITGKIEAFDKHWNISLVDVFEMWNRKKLHCCSRVALVDHEIENNMTTECERRLNEMNIKVPIVIHKSISRKLVTCSRHVPKLVVRGEHIAIITLDLDNDIKTG